LPLIVRHHRTVLFLTVWAAYLVTLFGVAGIRDGENPARSLVRVASSLVEVGLVALACAGCMRLALRGPRLPWLLASIVVAVSFAVVYLAQAFSLYVSRNFLTVLAMQNADSVGFLASTLLQVGAVALVAWAACYALSAGLASRAPRTMQGAAVRWPRSHYVLALAGCGILFAYLLAIQGGGARLEPGFRESPVASMVVNTARFAAGGRSGARVQAPERDLAQVDCFAYPERSLDFPFLRAEAFAAGPPFERTGAGRPPNIIVLFLEGLSARMVGAYGGNHPGLTPNLDRLAARTMRVDDYFNHTAATFRGLEGQLSSGYSFAGGRGGWIDAASRDGLSRIHRATLPRILAGAGYQSHMFVPHRQERPLIAMLQASGFDRVHTFRSIRRELLDGGGATRPGTSGLDDQSLFRGLRSFLERRERGGDGRPWFVGLYNIGTHAFLERSPNDVAYGNLGNPVLDKFHNLDQVLGEFLRYFFASPHARDTLLVVTSDHATYPEPAYRDAAGAELKPYFVDRIPLLVHDPLHRLPATLDAQGRNSLDLAPTVLQLAGIQARGNAFLGTSLFEPRNFPVGVAALGAKYFMTTPAGVFGMDEIPPAQREVFRCATDVVRHFYAMEAANRIVPPPAGSPELPGSPAAAGGQQVVQSARSSSTGANPP
jgi:phosphoglycerol transferase MdoB-like AlkP superfamily enzyme